MDEIVLEFTEIMPFDKKNYVSALISIKDDRGLTKFIWFFYTVIQLLCQWLPTNDFQSG